MTADPAVQIRLLDLQALDTALAQLAHRRRGLPELATIATATARLAALHGEAVDVQTKVSDLAVEQRRVENDIDVVRSREVRDQQRLASGGVPAKELEGLQHELQSLARRQSTLEDSALEIMQQREELETTLGTVVGEQEAVTAQREAADAARAAAWSEIDAEIAAKTAQRQGVAGEIVPELLALYDKVRESQGGVGAAAVRQRRCEGCRLELAGSELGRVRNAEPDEVVRCDNCRRILVRTPESGL